MKKSDSKKGKARKTPMLLYQIGAMWRTIILPRFIRRLQRRICLRDWEQRPDADEIRQRVDYYFPRRHPFTPGPAARPIGKIRLSESHSAYWYDLMRYLRACPSERKIEFIDGDTRENPASVVFGKARRLDSLAGNVALMNLDRRRHFLKVEDPIPFS